MKRLLGIAKQAAVYAILVIWLVLVVFPMVWLAYSSVKSTEEVFRDTWALPVRLEREDGGERAAWRADLQWRNYVTAWREAHIGKYFLNSVIVTAGSLLGVTLLGSMAAYVLGRFRFRANRPIFYTFLAGMMIPAQLTVVPLFFVLDFFHLLDTRSGLVCVYVAFSLPFTVFVLTSFFGTLPQELADAAAIDGCSEFQVFWRVMLPLAKPGLVTVTIFNFLGIWNEYLFALVFTFREHARTLPLGLANLMMVEHYQNDWGALFAGMAIVMLPTLAVYVLLQDRLTRGITLGALKG
ncbi:MAG: carbohydrate ABC transporter permease [Armatimonadota bacterium]